MTEIHEGQILERLIRVHGVDCPVVVGISNGGLIFRVKGTKKAVTISWSAAVAAGNTPGSAKSFLEGKPLEFLQHGARKVVANKEAKSE
jgi:hypothetical protein